MRKRPTEIDHGFAALREELVIFSELATFGEPRESSLDHPATWQNIDAAIKWI